MNLDLGDPVEAIARRLPGWCIILIVILTGVVAVSVVGLLWYCTLNSGDESRPVNVNVNVNVSPFGDHHPRVDASPTPQPAPPRE